MKATGALGRADGCGEQRAARRAACPVTANARVRAHSAGGAGNARARGAACGAVTRLRARAAGILSMSFWRLDLRLRSRFFSRVGSGSSDGPITLRTPHAAHQH
jgi:hypothetical protein